MLLKVTIMGAMLFTAGCFSEVTDSVSEGSGAGGAGGGDEASAATGAGGAGGNGGEGGTAPEECPAFEPGDDVNWQTLKDRCVNDHALPEPVCCESPAAMPEGCESTTYVAPCGMVWCCP
jgi:hypothetical protein